MGRPPLPDDKKGRLKILYVKLKISVYVVDFNTINTHLCSTLQQIKRILSIEFVFLHTNMSYLLPHLHTAYAVDQAILSVCVKIVVSLVPLVCTAVVTLPHAQSPLLASFAVHRKKHAW